MIKKSIKNSWKYVNWHASKCKRSALTALALSQLLSIGDLNATDLLFYANPEDSSYFAKLQDNLITGQIKDENGNFLQGVTITMKDQAKIATSTDANGRFVLEVPPNAVLIIKLVGFETQEIKTDTTTKELTLTLVEDLAGIDEVVVVGYGTQKKESNVGAQATIKREELKVPSANLSTAIAGRLAGVVATQRGGGPGSGGANLFVRGCIHLCELSSIAFINC